MTRAPGDRPSVATDAVPGLDDLRPLPGSVVELLARLDAPPLLVAHLRLVHDVAVDLTVWLGESFPAIEFDAGLVRFGAATHDIGKARWPTELHHPGSRHEADGERMLLDAGVPPDRARFAVTHNAWNDPRVALEDLLVAVADKVWKGRRDEDLEGRLVEILGVRSGRPHWDVFAVLDDELDVLARLADRRLAFQAKWSSRST